MPARPDDAVVVRGLERSYGRVRAVDGIDLTACRGAVTAVLGPNGAGKTTTVECCEGLRRPDAGSVRVLGADPLTADPAHRARVGVMLQDGGLPMGARALQLLHHVARLHAHPLPVGPLAERLGVDTFARTAVRRLSGGQRQRLALACALVGRPEVVFLDEPSAGLDPQARLAVWDLVAEVRDGGAAVVLTTHLMDEAERLADEVVVVDGGRVVAAGTPTQLTGGADHGESVRFSAAPRLDLTGLRTALPADVEVDEPRPGEYVVRGHVDPRVLSTVTSWCAAQGIMAQGLTVGRRSLEDVFLDLTGRSLR
ncbi:MAG TPA: ABC transporter ATP-binding protein [Angustibacter sp.]|nr:ABC transporter ATP-binding protein [Angustibacter sp.]